MSERIKDIIKAIILLVTVTVLFFIAGDFNIKSIVCKEASLIIYGDTIASGYKPFVENGKIYLSVDTINQFIDEELLYDKDTEKVILTTEDALYKFKVGNNIATKNLVEYDAKSSCKSVDDKVYVDMNLVKDIYDIKCEYDEETQTISIDKLDTSDLHLNYNQVKLYSNINTKSEILETLGVDNTVTVYTESLKHSRWYKVKSDSGKIGYIEKSAVTVNKNEEKEPEEENHNAKNEDKIIMFWQYKSRLDTLGDKEPGVNVVSPTWYELADENGSVEIEFDRDYYNKAKEYGYKLWPIITNGIDNPELDVPEITSKLLNSELNRENLIRNIVGIIESNQLDGINIDFESMRADDKAMFTQFLRELYPMVKSVGAKLSVDIYFTNSIDRSGVGKACDYVILMGYDQRGTWSKEPGSISEISWVNNNITSLINDSNIPSDHIILGVPFYTRIWDVEEDGTFETSIFTMKNVKEFVETYNLTPNMDNISGQNYVAIKDGTTTRKLWMEDIVSMEKRADIVLEHNLAGVAGWQRGTEISEVWEMFDRKFNNK